MVQQMFGEHQQIKQRLEAVQQNVDYNTLEQLAQFVYSHIRFEERQLFNEAEKKAAPEKLQKVAHLLKEEKSTAICEDAFWLK